MRKFLSALVALLALVRLRAYNVTGCSFPRSMTAMVFGYCVKPNLTVTDEKTLAAPPAVGFVASASWRRHVSPLPHRKKIQVPPP
ncbi:MAG: hypothetical protein ABI343_20855 [Burkholderiaceae bacterium]